MPSITPYTPVRTDYTDYPSSTAVAISGAELLARDEAIVEAIVAINALGTAADHPAGDFDTSGAAAAAQSAAATDATTKASGAQSAAISAAATDATTKAGNAQSAAISAAATDATTKANAATASALQKASNLVDLTNAATARTSLGLGTAAVANTGAFDTNGAATAAQAAAIAASNQRASNLSDVASPATALANLSGATLASMAQIKGARVYVEDSGAKGDAKVIYDGAITTATATFTSATAVFISGDVGKAITVAGAGAAAAQLTTTITGFTNSSTVTLATTAGTTVSGARTVYGTDDTAAIKAALATAVTNCQTAGTFRADVWFQSKLYFCNGPLTKGDAASLGNAIIPLPLVISTVHKVTLVLHGLSSAAYSHWNQTVPQHDGTTILTTLTGQTTDGTWGDPSIIGGPGPNYNGGVGSNDKFSNILVIIDGITVSAPQNPSFVGFDFRQCASAMVREAKAIAFIPVVATAPNLTTTPTNSLSLGLAMPKNSNNDISLVESFTCEGFYYGISINEHFNADRLGFLYVNTGVFIGVPGAAIHGASIRYIGLEYYKTGIEVVGSASSSFPIFVGLFDNEQLIAGGSGHLKDNNSSLYGEIGWASYDLTDPTIVGGLNVNFKNYRRPTGPMTAPTVPATTVAFTNTYRRTAAVVVAGGTMTANTKIDATDQLVQAGTFIVPGGHTITLTYSAAPSWAWTLLP